MANEEPNELSWLKNHHVNVGGPAKGGKVVTSQPAEAKDAPSWLFEHNDPVILPSAAKVSTDVSANPATNSAVYNSKAKEPVMKPPVDEEEEAEDESDTCCCCCPADPLLFSFQIFHFVSGLVGLLALAANIYIFTRPEVFVKDIIMRSYALIFCAVVVTVELDVRFVVTKIRFVDWWVLRGFFYTLVGFMTSELPYSLLGMFVAVHTVGITDTTVELSEAPQEVVGIMLALIGVCYIIMGTLCMKSMKHKREVQLLQRRQQRYYGGGGGGGGADSPV